MPGQVVLVWFYKASLRCSPVRNVCLPRAAPGRSATANSFQTVNPVKTTHLRRRPITSAALSQRAGDMPERGRIAC